jgi:hypothetical protein
MEVRGKGPAGVSARRPTAPGHHSNTGHAPLHAPGDTTELSDRRR